jgi:hypothetical protein
MFPKATFQVALKQHKKVRDRFNNFIFANLVKPKVAGKRAFVSATVLVIANFIGFSSRILTVYGRKKVVSQLILKQLNVEIKIRLHFQA